MVVLCRHLFEDTRALRTCFPYQIHRSLLPICVPVGLQHFLICWAHLAHFQYLTISNTLQIQYCYEAGIPGIFRHHHLLYEIP